MSGRNVKRPEVGAAIRAVRRLGQITQADLAAACEVSQVLISLVETGQREATSELVERAAQAFGERLAWWTPRAGEALARGAVLDLYVAVDAKKGQASD